MDSATHSPAQPPVAPRMSGGSRGSWKQLLAWGLILLLFFWFVSEIHSILLPFVVGVMAAYFLDPAADRLEAMGLNRTASTLVITVCFFLGITLACVAIVPLAVQQCADLIAAMPEYIQSLQDRYGMTIEHWISQFSDENGEALRNAASDIAAGSVKVAGEVLAGMFQSGMALVNIFSLLLITPLVVFYLLRDWDRVCARIDHLLPRAHAETIRAQLAAIDRTLAGFLRGQLNVCIILAAYYGIFLTLCGLQFGLIIGIITGFLVILPYVGFLFGFLIGMAVGLIQFGFTTPLLIIFGVYMVGQVLESFFLTPKLVGNGVGLHPLWIIFGMLAGGALFGFVGVLLALPATAVAGVLTRFAISRYLHSSLYHGN